MWCFCSSVGFCSPWSMMCVEFAYICSVSWRYFISSRSIFVNAGGNALGTTQYPSLSSESPTAGVTSDCQWALVASSNASLGRCSVAMVLVDAQSTRRRTTLPHLCDPRICRVNTASELSMFGHQSPNNNWFENWPINSVGAKRILVRSEMIIRAMAALPRKSYAANVHVPCAVVERALLRDMIYAACPRCLTSLNAALQRAPLGSEHVTCSACGTTARADTIAYKYRLKLTLLIDMQVRDAMLFDEVAQTLLGTPAARLRKLLTEYPSLPSLLEELLLGLRVSFSYQPAQNRQNTENKYQRDLKVLTIQPLVPALLPKPLVSLAMAHLTREHAKRTRAESETSTSRPL